MNTETTPSAADAPRPTQHGLLVCWGQFAHELGLLDHLPAAQRAGAWA